MFLTWLDRYLDKALCGSVFLEREETPSMAVDAIHYGASYLRHYDLHSFVVMANHVHLLILPLVAPSKVLQSLKGFTARAANKILDRTGQPFWQHESYDHWIRDTSAEVHRT